MNKTARLGALVAVFVACNNGGTTQPTSPPPSSPVAPPALPPPPPPAKPILGGLCPAPNAPKGPLEYGQCVLAQAITRSKTTATVQVVLASDPAAQGVDVQPQPESFSIVSQGDHTFVVGRDPVGAMYGAMEVAERLDTQGPAALPLPTPVKQSPFMKVRAANLFLVLPEAGQPWWFKDPEFWTEYLDMMARARMNLLDMHGMYNLQNTVFPNLLLYFATAASMPDVGLPQAEREANLAMLNTVLAMAEVRGIRVGLMNYRVDLSPLGNEKETDEEKARVPQYNREAVADLATRVPGLSYLGFRVGETGRKPDWYVSTYVEPLKAVHSKAVAYTRTWLTTKKDLLSVIEASGPETVVEAKYNGEQLGPPYIISGGGMDRWKSYSYEDFLTPPAPYRFVFQIRAGGTHRMFRYASYARTKREVMAMGMSPRIEGFTLEAAHAYLPQRDFYHANPADSFSPYAFRRDELSYLLFGRLGYDPETPEAVFKKMLKDRVGTDALWEPMQSASDIVPWMLAGNTCGADQRDYAPELELGGTVAYWATPIHTKGAKFVCEKSHQPFDNFAVAGPNETAAHILTRQGESRLTPADLALILLADARAARGATTVTVDPNNPEARDIVRECVALADLGEWFAHKFRAATALAVYEGSQSAAWLGAAKTETKEEQQAWAQLSQDTAYIAPFEERMRMHRIGMPGLYHWNKLLPEVAEDTQAIDEVVRDVKAGGAPVATGPLPAPKQWFSTPRSAGPGLKELKIVPPNPKADSWTVTATLAAPAPKGAVVHILRRRWKSDAGDWAAVETTGSGATWTATMQGSGDGGMFAVEVVAGPGQAWRYPDVIKETPYKVLAP
jgi:hypothetical protein